MRLAACSQVMTIADVLFLPIVVAGLTGEDDQISDGVMRGFDAATERGTIAGDVAARCARGDEADGVRLCVRERRRREENQDCKELHCL